MNINHYALANDFNSEYLNEEGRLNTHVRLSINGGYNRIHAYFQSRFPKKYENYNIRMVITHRHQEKISIHSIAIEDIRIILPSGNIIDLLNDKIEIMYSYYESEAITGIPFKEIIGVPVLIENNKKYITTVWEDLETNKEIFNLYFKKITNKYYPISV